MLYDLFGRTTQRVIFFGEASLTGLGVGGGPIIPDLPGGSPPGMWGPTDPRPTNPIAGIPGLPGYTPPGGGLPPGQPTFPIWGPPGISLPPGSGYPPVAGHPLPPPGDKPPAPIVGWEAKVYWTPETGWGVAIVPKEGTQVPTPSKK